MRIPSIDKHALSMPAPRFVEVVDVSAEASSTVAALLASGQGLVGKLSFNVSEYLNTSYGRDVLLSTLTAYNVTPDWGRLAMGRAGWRAQHHASRRASTPRPRTPLAPGGRRHGDTARSRGPLARASAAQTVRALRVVHRLWVAAHGSRELRDGVHAERHCVWVHAGRNVVLAGRL